MKGFRMMVNEAMIEIENDGFIEKTMKETIEKTVTGIIATSFRQYSDFGKAMQEAIKNEIKIDFDKLSLGAYSTTITAMLSGMMKEKMETDARVAAERFLKTIDAGKIPEELKITEMVEHIAGLWTEYDEDAKREGFTFSFHYVQSWPDRETLKHCYSIRIDKEAGAEPSECEINIDYDDERQEITDVEINKQSVKNTTFYTTKSWNIEGYIFQLYANKVKLINDAEDVEPYVSGEYEY